MYFPWIVTSQVKNKTKIPVAADRGHWRSEEDQKCREAENNWWHTFQFQKINDTTSATNQLPTEISTSRTCSVTLSVWWETAVLHLDFPTPGVNTHQDSQGTTSWSSLILMRLVLNSYFCTHHSFQVHLESIPTNMASLVASDLHLLWYCYSMSKAIKFVCCRLFQVYL